MLANRPLLPTLADSEFFVWTPSAVDLRDAALLGRNSLLVGDRGAGKTSLLHMVERTLRGEGRPVAFASLVGTADPYEAVLAVVRAARRAEWGVRAAEEVDADDPFAATATVRRLANAPSGAVMLVDDVGLEAGAALFGRLRDELWQLPPSWVVAAATDDVGPLLSPPADAFFERRVVVPSLEPDERYELLRRRTKGPPDALPDETVRALARAGVGNPRELISLARDSRDLGITVDDLAAARERRRAAAAGAAGDPGVRVVAAMSDLGPVSASDPRLLDRLGWDRPRLSRTLNKLVRDGVVDTYPEPREGRIGRRRHLYALKPLREFAR